MWPEVIELKGKVTLRVKNWKRFQHYRDRRPEWIKLHRTTLDDFKYHGLPLASRALAPLVWLLASEYDEGVIEAEMGEMAFRFRITEGDLREALIPLIESDFLILEQDGYEPQEREEWPSRYVPDALRIKILARDGNKCVTCGSDENLEIDHKIPVSKGGTGVEENLQTLCRKCNRRKRVKTAEQVATQNTNLRSLEGEKRESKSERRVEGEYCPQIDIIPITSDLPPAGLHHLQYARYFWEQLGMPTSQTSLEIAGSAIKNYANSENSPMHVAVVTLLARAQIDRELGKTINRFWFEDGKHTGKANGNGRELTKTEQRITNNRKNLAAGAADYLASRGVVGHPRTDVPDGSTDATVDPVVAGKPRLLPPSGSR